MVSITISLLSILAALGETYRPPRQAPGPQQAQRSAGPDTTLSDADVRARVLLYLQSIDVPVTSDEWRALGPRAVPQLEQVLTNTGELPSRRAAAVGGLAAIGGARARELVLAAARSQQEPFAVRVAALHGASLLLAPPDLARELTPVLRDAAEPAARAAAAEVLARHAPREACGAIRKQAEKERGAPGGFARALSLCEPAPDER